MFLVGLQLNGKKRCLPKPHPTYLPIYHNAELVTHSVSQLTKSYLYWYRESSMGTEHPCMFLLDIPSMGNPDHSFLGPFLRVVFAVSNNEGWSNNFLQISCLLLFIIQGEPLLPSPSQDQCSSSVTQLSVCIGIYLWALGILSVGLRRHEGSTQAARFYFALSSK